MLPSKINWAGSPLSPGVYSSNLSSAITKLESLSKKSFTSNSDFKLIAPIPADIVMAIDRGITI